MSERHQSDLATARLLRHVFFTPAHFVTIFFVLLLKAVNINLIRSKLTNPTGFLLWPTITQFYSHHDLAGALSISLLHVLILKFDFFNKRQRLNVLSPCRVTKRAAVTKCAPTALSPLYGSLHTNNLTSPPIELWW